MGASGVDVRLGKARPRLPRIPHREQTHVIPLADFTGCAAMVTDSFPPTTTITTITTPALSTCSSSNMHSCSLTGWAFTLKCTATKQMATLGALHCADFFSGLLIYCVHVSVIQNRAAADQFKGRLPGWQVGECVCAKKVAVLWPKKNQKTKKKSTKTNVTCRCSHGWPLGASWSCDTPGCFECEMEQRAA